MLIKKYKSKSGNFSSNYLNVKQKLVIFMVKEAKPREEKGEKATAVTSSEAKKKKRKLYNVTFFHNWCKSCGICSALCVRQIIKTDKQGVPYIDDMDSCSGCCFCEIHCPDFAITIEERYPERRRTNGNS
jgi:2-oxoglutarate ferredoxin oxidoreductase subunit delta